MDGIIVQRTLAGWLSQQLAISTGVCRVGYGRAVDSAVKQRSVLAGIYLCPHVLIVIPIHTGWNVFDNGARAPHTEIEDRFC